MFTPDTYKKVKLVATIGPVSNSVEMICLMAKAGADVFRINTSHTSQKELTTYVANVRKAERMVRRPLAILCDLEGPKIRIGDVNGEYMLPTGKHITILRKKCLGNDASFSLNHPSILNSFTKGTHLFLGDGDIELEIIKIMPDRAIAKVVASGDIRSRMGLYAQDIIVRTTSLTANDKLSIQTALKSGVDAFALSFVQSAKDVRAVRALLPRNKKLMLIAKIETRPGVENVKSILAEADGLMVARGDLGFAVPLASVPYIQKNLVQLCRETCKPVIIATQMLESMISHHVPTRAEVSDVANAILDGTDAVMLSAETATGRYPVETIETMTRIIQGTTPQLHYATYPLHQLIPDAVSHTVVTLADEVEAKLIIVFTESGITARRISRHRPRQAIIVSSPNPRTLRHMNFSWGTIPLLDPAAKNFDQALEKAHHIAAHNSVVKLKKGDTFVVSAGVPFGKPGSTNLAVVQHI